VQPNNFDQEAYQQAAAHTLTAMSLALPPADLTRFSNRPIKGEEVISNVGRVARGSTLSRFISAKDDNENKT
jgi:hypothetical protein